MRLPNWMTRFFRRRGDRMIQTPPAPKEFPNLPRRLTAEEIVERAELRRRAAK